MYLDVGNAEVTRCGSELYARCGFSNDCHRILDIDCLRHFLLFEIFYLIGKLPRKKNRRHFRWITSNFVHFLSTAAPMIHLGSIMGLHPYMHAGLREARCCTARSRQEKAVHGQYTFSNSAAVSKGRSRGVSRVCYSMPRCSPPPSLRRVTVHRWLSFLLIPPTIAFPVSVRVPGSRQPTCITVEIHECSPAHLHFIHMQTAHSHSLNGTLKRTFILAQRPTASGEFIVQVSHYPPYQVVV